MDKYSASSHEFCFNHLVEHRQKLSQQLNDIQLDHDLLVQTIHQQTTDPYKHSFIQQTDQRKQEAIERMKRTAEEARRLLSTHVQKQINLTKQKLDLLIQQLKHNRDEDDTSETDSKKINQQY